MTVSSHATIDELSACLKVLSDRTRLLMLKVMTKKAYCVCQLVEMFEMSQPAVSQHIAKLKQMHLLTESRKGQWRFYTLNKRAPQYELAMAVLEQIAIDDVTLCAVLENERSADC
ncbi:ArsR/SmtB family transcription factor [Shouchella lonarensis]|uniref:Transcriptional regulator, ArsR family n=1 Tax=Shouchella lonarensis TaxID=1464122 RepID=A0A1G6MX63_9BACI|nr:metalloregulator ArsR/SmtB family transcription factor [Shouchella lonarensis]SDC59576.1 transcriptional regulator, ArsR family [Shouchella lonarensis]